MRTGNYAAIIQERKILLVKKKESWILPGGKPEKGESNIECLVREVGEELSGTQLENIRSYGLFEGRTPHKRDILIARAYLADIKGELGKPSNEISAAEWADNPGKYNLSDITSKIVDSLRKEHHL